MRDLSAAVSLANCPSSAQCKPLTVNHLQSAVQTQQSLKHNRLLMGKIESKSHYIFFFKSHISHSFTVNGANSYLLLTMTTGWKNTYELARVVHTKERLLGLFHLWWGSSMLCCSPAAPWGYESETLEIKIILVASPSLIGTEFKQCGCSNEGMSGLWPFPILLCLHARYQYQLLFFLN